MSWGERRLLRALALVALLAAIVLRSETRGLYSFTAGLLLSLIAGLIAGIYPSWRICRVALATYLKEQ